MVYFTGLPDVFQQKWDNLFRVIQVKYRYIRLKGEVRHIGNHVFQAASRRFVVPFTQQMDLFLSAQFVALSDDKIYIFNAVQQRFQIGIQSRMSENSSSLMICSAPARVRR